MEVLATWFIIALMNSKIDKEKLRKECLKNAEDLLEESKLLFSKQKYSRATTLAITSYEESLKAGLVGSLQNGHVTMQEFKRICFRHELKYLLKYAVIRAKIYANEEKIEFGLLLPSNRKEDAKEIFDIRNNSLYVGFSNKDIGAPKKTIGVHQAIKYIKMAQKQFEWEEMVESLKERIKKEIDP